MTEETWTLTIGAGYAAGIAQGVFLAFVLLTLGFRNTTASRTLAALVMVLSLMLADEFLDLAEIGPSLGTGLALELAIGPLLWLFITAVSQERFAWTARLWLHFIPCLVALALLVVVHSTSGQPVSVSRPVIGPWLTGWVCLKMLYLAAYLWAAFRVLRRNLDRTTRRDNRELAWLRRWLIFVVVVVAAGYLHFFAFATSGFSIPDADVLSGLLSAATIFSVAWFCIAKRGVLDRAAPRAALQPGDARIWEKVLATVESQRPFTDPEFDLETLALGLGTPADTIQRVFDQRCEGGFSQWLIEKRIAEFQRLLTIDRWADSSLLDTAFEAGFNSKATFYRAFTASEGMSPGEFRRRLSQP